MTKLKLPHFPSSPIQLDEGVEEKVLRFSEQVGITTIEAMIVNASNPAEKKGVFVLGSSVEVKGFILEPSYVMHTYHRLVIRPESIMERPYTHTQVRGWGPWEDVVSDFLLSRENRERRKGMEKYHADVRNYYGANLKDADQRTQHIRIYQGSMEEVESDLGKPLQRVDLKGPKTYLKAPDELWLRIQAHNVGADAIIHCQPGSAIGTPVRYVR